MTVSGASVGGANLSDDIGAGGAGGGGGILEDGNTNFETIGEDTSISGGTTLTGGAQNVKGAYVELVASSSFAAAGIIVNIGASSANANYAVDIAVGAAASETVIVPDVLCDGFAQSSSPGISVFFPISIPSGVRVSARVAASTASATMEVACVLMGGTAPTHTAITAEGINTTRSNQIVMTGETANVKTAYTEITASTTNATTFMVVCMNPQCNVNDTRFLIDIATGAVSSEVIVLSNLYVTVDSLFREDSVYTGVFPITIAAGTRLSFRVQSEEVGSSFACGVALYTV